jgi:hypothetical protein
MAKIKTVTSRKTDSGTVYDFRCPLPYGCGAVATDPEFRFESAGWFDREHAADRGRQHVAEHDGVPMQPLDEFRTERGLVAETAGLPDLDDVEF